MTVLEASQIPLKDYLGEVGNRIGCYFTFEYRGHAVTGRPSNLQGVVSNDLTVASIPALRSKLRSDLHGFSVVQDSKNPKILHLIEQELERQPDNVLNQKINLIYSGNLVACVVKDIQGRNLSNGEGLVAAMGKIVGGIRDGSEEAGSNILEGQITDCVTVVNINATNQTVRSILTDYLPATNYCSILWRAVTTRQEGKPMVLVQFYGPRN